MTRWTGMVNKMGADKNRFLELAKIDCSEYVEKKGKLSYLSWTWAWKKLLELYPDSYATVYEDNGGRVYFTDGKTAWVKTGVTLIDGEYCKEAIEYLPVMDNQNNSIPLERITSTAVNKAIQRSITKAIARHGLGLYIYSGEDLPEDANEQNKSEPPKLICAMCKGSILSLSDKNGVIIKDAQGVAEFTEKESGKKLCWGCYKAWKAEEKK